MFPRARPILIVEPDPVAQLQLTSLLQHEGLTALVLSSASDAIRHLHGLESPSSRTAKCSALFIAWQSGDSSAVELIDEVRARPIWQDLPLVVLDDAESELRRRALTPYALAGYLAKPLQRKKLRRVLEQVFRRG